MTSGRFIAVICGLKSEAAAVRAASSSGALRVGASGCRGPIDLRTRNRIRALHGERNLSRAEFAYCAGDMRNPVNSAGNGRFDPSLPLAFDLARALALRVEGVFIR